MDQTPASVILEIGSAKLTVATDELFRAWLAQQVGVPPMPVVPAHPHSPPLNAGEHYAGIILGRHGEPDYHLILLPCEADKVTWAKAKEWAREAGGELPTRREQSLLYANLREQFQDAWYWSAEAHVSDSDYAWSQGFGNGYQFYTSTDDQFRAQAVRRLPI